MKRLFFAAALLAVLSSHAWAQGKAYSNVTPVAPTAGTFSQLLARSDNRTSCVITNIGTTQGYVQAVPPGFTPTISNSIPVTANGGQFFCGSISANLVIQDQIQGTCASGTCAFVVNSTGQ